jgi:phage terminase small subunit
MPLNERQQRFVEEYLIDLNATAAYRRAGYQPKSEKAATANSSRLMANDSIKAEIRKRRRQQSRETRITANRVLKELALIAFSRLRDYGKWNAGGFFINDSGRLPYDKDKAVAEFSQTRTASGGSTKFKLHDKVAALKLLGEHLGLWGRVDEQEKFLNGLPERLRAVFRQLLSEPAPNSQPQIPFNGVREPASGDGSVGPD